MSQQQFCSVQAQEVAPALAALQSQVISIHYAADMWEYMCNSGRSPWLCSRHEIHICAPCSVHLTLPDTSHDCTLRCCFGIAVVIAVTQSGSLHVATATLYTVLYGV